LSVGLFSPFAPIGSWQAEDGKLIAPWQDRAIGAIGADNEMTYGRHSEFPLAVLFR